MFKVNESQTIIDAEVNKIVKAIFDNRNNDDFYLKGVFNTKDLPNHINYTYFPNIDINFRNIIFNKLNAIRKNHCLYWFELESKSKATRLNSLIDEYRKKENELSYKKVPVKNACEKNSNVLYLGVRQGGYRKRDNLTNITGRMLQHLGYYHVGSTQGLQLYEYARDKDFEITIKVFEFDGLKPYCLNVIEKLLAKKMMPLCGTH